MRPPLLVVWPEVTSKGLSATRASQYCCQCPCPHIRPLLTQMLSETPNTAGRSGSVSQGHCSFLGLCAQGLFVPSKSSRFQSCGSLTVKSHCPSKSDSQRIPSPFAKSTGWEVWWAQNLPTVEELLCTFLWAAHGTGRAMWLILMWSTLLLSHVVFFSSFNPRDIYDFFRFKHSSCQRFVQQLLAI